jgi:hypothetical protein
MDWKDAKKHPPKKAGHYLVVADWMGVIEKGEFDTKRGIWNCPFGGDCVTHYMELPEPPKEIPDTPVILGPAMSGSTPRCRIGDGY